MQKALFNLPVLMAALFSLAATVALTTLVFAEKPEPPTKLLDNRPVPDFTVTTHQDETLTRDDMLGKVWICDFFFTTCNAICPRLSLTMAEVGDDLGQDPDLKDVTLVSFTVDPENDTPQRLRDYRAANQGGWSGRDDARWEQIDQRWLHVRADDKLAFWKIVEDGFGLLVGDSDDPKTPIGHSGKLVLIDKQGRIRGYYDGLTDTDIPALLADVRRLVQEPPAD